MPPRKAAETAAMPSPKRTQSRWPASLPFVVFENDQFTVNAEAAAFLEQLGDVPLGVVALAGPYRHGKSFLLNRVLLQNTPGEGFMVGQTVNACTKGLHLSTKLLQPERSNYQVLVIDTEGLGAVSATDTHDARIFSLALLLSSMFLYNSKGTIDQPAINNLSLVANISEHIKGSTNSNNQKDLSDLFPVFLWVVRDFSLDLVNEDGEPLQPDEYLENALRPLPNVPQEKNKVRESLVKFFKDRGCLTMVRPCDDEGTLKSLNTHDNAVLKPQFMEQAAQLRHMVMTRAKPKNISNIQLTGAVLVRLARVYCDAINKGVAPAIQDSWSLISADECAKAVQIAKDAFRAYLAEMHVDGSALDRHRERKAIPAAVLEQAFTVGFERAFQMYKSKAVGDRAEEYREKLRDMLRDTAAQLRTDNQAIIGRKAERICDDFNEGFMSFNTFEDVRASFVDTEAAFYKEVGKDPISRAALFEQIGKRVWDWATRYHAQLATNCQVLEVRVASADQTVASMRHELDQTHSKLQTVSEQINVTQQQYHVLQETHGELETKTKTLETELADMIEQYEQQEQRQREQQVVWQQQLETAQSATLQYSQTSTDLMVEHQNLQQVLSDTQLQLTNALRDADNAHRAQADLLHAQQDLSKAEYTCEMLQRQNHDLTTQLNKSADEHCRELAQLNEASTAVIMDLSSIRDHAVQSARELEKRNKDLLQTLDVYKQKMALVQGDLVKLQHEMQTCTTERNDLKTELAEVRSEAAKNVKTFQRQLDEQASQNRDEARKRAAKVREETDKLFQEKLAAASRAQNAEARVGHLEDALKEAKDSVLRERERMRDQNWSGKIADLESKLATATTRHDLLQASLRDKTDQVTEQQSRITDLEASLRQIEQRHEAEKMRIVLDYARKVVQNDSK